MKNIGLLLLQFWRGKLPLKQAFLSVFVPISIAWYLIKIVAKELVHSEAIYLFGAETLSLFLVGIVFGVYRFVGLWRCSQNTDSALFHYGAKLLALYMISPALINVATYIYIRATL